MAKIVVSITSLGVLWLVINYGYLLIEQGDYGQYTQFQTVITSKDGENFRKEFRAYGTFNDFYLAFVFHLPEDITNEEAFENSFFQNAQNAIKETKITISEASGNTLKTRVLSEPSSLNIGENRKQYAFIWNIELRSTKKYYLEVELPKGFHNKFEQYSPIVLHISRNPVPTL